MIGAGVLRPLGLSVTRTVERQVGIRSQKAVDSTLSTLDLEQ